MFWEKTKYVLYFKFGKVATVCLYDSFARSSRKYTAGSVPRYCWHGAKTPRCCNKTYNSGAQLSKMKSQLKIFNNFSSTFEVSSSVVAKK